MHRSPRRLRGARAGIHPGSDPARYRRAVAVEQRGCRRRHHGHGSPIAQHRVPEAGQPFRYRSARRSVAAWSRPRSSRPGSARRARRRSARAVRRACRADSSSPRRCVRRSRRRSARSRWARRRSWLRVIACVRGARRSVGAAVPLRRRARHNRGGGGHADERRRQRSRGSEQVPRSVAPGAVDARRHDARHRGGRRERARSCSRAGSVLARITALCRS